MLLIVAKILAITIPLSLVVALIYLGKQKVMASMQRRKGANVVGVLGTVSRLKMVFKERMRLNSANVVIFLVIFFIIFLFCFLLDQNTDVLSQNTNVLSSVEAEVQRRTVEKVQIEQLLKRFGR
jgi:NADH-quinone oxidoreductase subunit H